MKQYAIRSNDSCAAARRICVRARTLRDVHNGETLLEAFDRIAAGPRPPLVRDKAIEARLSNGIRYESVIELLCVVDLLTRGDASHVDVADVLKVVPHVPHDIAVHDLHV